MLLGVLGTCCKEVTAGVAIAERRRLGINRGVYCSRRLVVVEGGDCVCHRCTM